MCLYKETQIQYQEFCMALVDFMESFYIVFTKHERVFKGKQSGMYIVSWSYHLYDQTRYRGSRFISITADIRLLN